MKKWLELKWKRSSENMNSHSQNVCKVRNFKVHVNWRTWALDNTIVELINPFKGVSFFPYFLSKFAHFQHQLWCLFYELFKAFRIEFAHLAHYYWHTNSKQMQSIWKSIWKLDFELWIGVSIAVCKMCKF